MSTENGTNKSPRLIRYEDYASRHKASADSLSSLEQAHREFLEAQKRYQKTLQAFPPSYYDEVMRKQQASPSASVADAPPPITSGITDELTNHNYDGIQEFDNPTPGWWYAVFAACVVFSLLYVFVYHMSTMVPSLPERHARAEAAALERQFSELNKIPMGESKILTIMANADWTSRGQAIFEGTCAVCHNADASGNVGPNLTDEKYHLITRLTDISDLVSNGTPDGAMPAQKNMLNENEIALVAAYVASLRGKDLPTGANVNPAYTGEEIAPWPPLPEGSGTRSAQPETGEQVSMRD